MGTQPLKYTNIDDLPVSGDINSDDYLIVQGSEVTTRVQFSDFVFGKENTTFGQEINDLYEKLEAVTSQIDDLPKTTDTYNKSEVDQKLDTKADSNTVYTKNIIDGKFLVTYKKSEIDSKISAIENKLEELSKIDDLNNKLDNINNNLTGILNRLAALEKHHNE